MLRLQFRNTGIDMTTRARGPLAGLDWLRRGINLGRHNPRAVFGGAVLIALAALLPSLLQLLLLKLLSPGATGMMVVVALSTALSLVLMPPMIGGYLQVIDASEHGRPAQAGGVFAPFRSAPQLRRLIGFGALMMLAYLAIAWLLVMWLCPDFIGWYTQVMQLSQGGTPVDPNAIPPLPEGLGALLGLGALVGIFLGSVYAIGFGQIALGGQRLGRALGDGVSGALRNLLPLLLLALLGFLLMLALLLVTGLLGLALGFAGGLLHPALGALLGMAVYMLMLLLMYVVVFGVMYHLWRDVAAADAGTPPPMTTPGQVEL